MVEEKTLSKHPPDQNSRFNDICREAVEETIRDVLGATVAEAYMKYTHNSLGISDEEMSTSLNVIFSSLKTIFAPGGNILGMRIVKKLYLKAGKSFQETPGLTPENYVKGLKQEFLKKPTD